MRAREQYIAGMRREVDDTSFNGCNLTYFVVLSPGGDSVRRGKSP